MKQLHLRTRCHKRIINPFKSARAIFTRIFSKKRIVHLGSFQKTHCPQIALDGPSPAISNTFLHKSLSFLDPPTVSKGGVRFFLAGELPWLVVQSKLTDRNPVILDLFNTFELVVRLTEEGLISLVDLFSLGGPHRGCLCEVCLSGIEEDCC